MPPVANIRTMFRFFQPTILDFGVPAIRVALPGVASCRLTECEGVKVWHLRRLIGDVGGWGDA